MAPPPWLPPGSPGAAPLPRGLRAKAFALLLLMALLLAGAVAYVLHARGVFEATQRLVLVADDAEGVTVGMDLSFAGFPIGRVQGLELAPDGSARILIDVPRKDAHWLRTSSVFTLVRGILGTTNLRAYSGQLKDPPLPDNAERRVLAGDATTEIPQLVAAARELTQRLSALAAPDAALAASLAQLQAATEKLNGPEGALGLLAGNEKDRRLILATLERSQALMARAEALAQRLDGLAAQADRQVFGADGLLPETRNTVLQLGTLLGQARGTLQQVDKLLVEAQGVAANARSATADLGPLRAEVEASLRKLQGLVDELNRRWPFAREAEVKLP